MRDSPVIIERIKRISPTVQHLEIAVENPHRSIQPGQLFLARVTDSLDPYLREPWIPVRKKGSVITIERPIYPAFQPGQVVSLLGPLGKPLVMRQTARTLLLIAYDASPSALLMIAHAALENRVSVTLALIGAAAFYPIDSLPNEIEIVRGDDKGKLPGERDYIKWADQVVAIAAPPTDLSRYHALLAAIQSYKTEVPRGYVSAIFQRPMPCGVGACGACLLRCHAHERTVCGDGPTFDLLDVSLSSPS